MANIKSIYGNPVVDDSLRKSVAAEYSSSSTYAVGDIVLKDGALYKCSTAISTAEAWNSAHWTADTVGSELSQLKEDLNNSKTELKNDIYGLAYQGNLIVNEYLQGDRSTTNPYVADGTANRITLAYPITVHKGDVLKISCPQGKKVGYVTSTGISSGFSTSDRTVNISADMDIFIIMANTDTSTAITPADGIAAEMTVVFQDNSSRITTAEKSIARIDSTTIELISISAININGYTVNNGRVYSTSSDTKRSDFIAIKSGTKIAYKLQSINAINLISFYTDKTATSSAASSYVGGVAGNTGSYVEGVYTAPQDGYIIFTNGNAYTDAYIGCVGGMYTVDKRLDALEQTVGVADLTGKYILNFGDSLANGYGNSGSSYADMIALNTGGTLADYAVNGTPYANYGQTSDYACVFNQVMTAILDHGNDDVALIFVEGGINDLKRNVLDIGTLSDNYDGTYSTGMIIGATESIFYQLKNAFPSAKIVFVMYHRMPLSTATPALDYEDMYARQNTEYDGFKSACSKWSIPMADVYGEGNLNSNIQAMAETYFGVDANEKFGRDIAHPNALGYRKFYVPLIMQKLKLSTYE